MGQAWKEQLEAGFRPAVVKTMWKDDELLVLAELDDDCLFTQATQDNQHIYKFGDVLELFLRDLEGEQYAELHVAPNGRRLQLLFPDAAKIVEIRGGAPTIEQQLVHEPIFDFTQWMTPGKWFVFARVSVKIFLGRKQPLLGRRWLASFSRYDYSSAETKPICSSTSPHRVSNFHRQDAWAELEFVG